MNTLEITRHTEIQAVPYERNEFEVRSAGQKLAGYIHSAMDESRNPVFNPMGEQHWGAVLPRFTRDLVHRLEKSDSHDDLASVIAPVILRGVEFVSGGVLSQHDLAEGEARGLGRGGTWPVVPGGEFWDPRERSPRSPKIEIHMNGNGRVDTKRESERKRKTEGELIREIVDRSLLLPTDASEGHVGRVLTMSLPALLSWSDLEREFTPQNEIVDEHVETVRRMLDAERTGFFDVVTFGCEPYQYGYNPGTTTTHIRRSEFGNESTLRPDAIQGSFRGVRRILEPLALSGVQTSYRFYTSAGNSWDLIQRQVMPDTKEFYRNNRSPQEMLRVLQGWNDLIETTGVQELEGSGVQFLTMPMEQEVVYPALLNMYDVMRACGMDLPEDPDEFAFNSEELFVSHMHELNFYNVISNHPNPEQFMEYFKNEEEWSRKHPEAYQSEAHRIAQAALLAAFEYHQYERINEIINATGGIALGVEIDEELINKTRAAALERGEEQVPLLWGRPPRYTKDGQRGGVAHRQPWFYEK